jgi:hypothetical protein
VLELGCAAPGRELAGARPRSETGGTDLWREARRRVVGVAWNGAAADEMEAEGASVGETSHLDKAVVAQNCQRCDDPEVVARAMRKQCGGTRTSPPEAARRCGETDCMGGLLVAVDGRPKNGRTGGNDIRRHQPSVDHLKGIGCHGRWRPEARYAVSCSDFDWTECSRVRPSVVRLRWVWKTFQRC